MNQAGVIFAGISAAMSVAGVAATYTRGDTAIDLTALPGAKLPQRALDGVGPVQLCDASYILQTASLDELTLPREGDRLTVDQGGRLQVFELQELPSGAQAWSYLPGNEFVRLLLTLVNDSEGAAPDHEEAVTAAVGTGVKVSRSTQTITADSPLTLNATGFTTLRTVDVWMKIGATTYKRVGPGVVVEVTDGTPPSITLTSGVTLTNCRVELIGT